VGKRGMERLFSSFYPRKAEFTRDRGSTEVNTGCKAAGGRNPARPETG
jgi:hypothetical protein